MCELFLSIVRLIYGVFLLLLQLKVAFVLVNERKKFNSTFYRLLMFNNMSCVFLWVCVQFENNYPIWCAILRFLPQLDDYQYFTSFVVYSHRCFTFSWLAAFLSLALNRLSFFIYNDEKEKVWSKLFFVILLVGVVGPRLIFYDLGVGASRFVEINSSILSYYEVEYEGDFSASHYISLSSLFELIFLLVALIMVIITVQIQRNQLNSSCDQCRKGLNFVWILICDVFLHFFWTLNDVALLLSTSRNVVTIIYIFLKEVIPLMYGVCLIIFDEELRKSVLARSRTKKSVDSALFSDEVQNE